MCVYTNMPLDTRHFFTSIVAFMLCISGIFNTLSVNNEKARIFISPLTLSDCRCLIFLMQPRIGLALRLEELCSTIGNMNKQSAIWGSREVSSAIESLFSGHIGWHRKPQKDRQYEVWFFCVHFRAMVV